MKQVHPNYTFDASTKTITLTGLNIAQDQLLLITNATRGVIYYNFASSSHRAVVTAGASTTVVLTDASTTGHANQDQLVIHYDDHLSTQTVAGTVTANSLSDIYDPNKDIYLKNSSLYYFDVNATENRQVQNVSDGNGGPLPISGTVTANSPSLNFDSQLFTGMQLVTDTTLTFSSSAEVLYAGLTSQTATSAVVPSTAVKGRCFLVRIFNNVGSGATIQGAFHGMGSRPSFLPDNTFSFRLGNAATNLGFSDAAITINSDNISNYYLFVAGVSEPEFGPGSSISGLAAFNLNFGLHRLTGAGVTRVQIYNVPMPPEAALNTVIHNNLRRFLGRTTDSAASSDSESGSFVSQFKRLQGKIPSLSMGRVPVDGSAVTQPVTNRGATGEATVSNFTSTTSATLKSSNSNRKVLTIYNEGAGDLHVLYGSGTASTTNYSVKLFSGGYLEIDKYTGQVNAIFATAGTARVTEIT